MPETVEVREHRLERLEAFLKQWGTTEVADALKRSEEHIIYNGEPPDANVHRDAWFVRKVADLLQVGSEQRQMAVVHGDGAVLT